MSCLIRVRGARAYGAPAKRLHRAALVVLEQAGTDPDSELAVIVTGDEEVAELNKRYRGVESVTDVLSFPAEMPAIPGEPPYLGDVVIAHPYTSRQAQRLGHDLNDTLALLVVHGTLHLLGHEHDTPERRAAMWAAQEAALRKLGVPLEIVPALEEDDDH